MSKFVNAGAKESLVRAAKYMAMCGLLLLVSYLTFVQPNRAEAGITNSVTFFNDTDNPITPVIDGHEYGPVSPGESVNLSCTDPSNGITTLEAFDGDGFDNKIVVTENRNNPVWVVSENDLRSSPQ